MTSSHSHTALRPFHAQETGDIVRKGDGFTPENGVRAKELEKLGLIREGGEPRRAPANKDAAAQRKTKK